MSHDLSPPPSDERPWYRQFWPWFLILLPATSVVGGIALVIIAVKNADDVVADSWYKDGRAINRSMDEENLAARLGITLAASAQGDALQARLSSDTPFPPPATLTLALRHPTLAAQDRVFPLAHQPDGTYRGDGDLPDGRWVVTVSPGDGNWQLYSMGVIIRNGRFTLSAGG
ncbi:MAG: FixH family protein [Alcanivoracaceae bacterium]|jgi:hypothetical protein